MTNMNLLNVLSIQSPFSVPSGGETQTKVLQNIYGQEERIDRLLRSFVSILLGKKQMLRLSEVKKMNVLDACALLPEDENEYTAPSIPPVSEEEQKFADKLGWYALVPCFESGALRINKFRYLVFEVQSIDPEKRELAVRIHDYMRIRSLWQPGISVTAHVRVKTLPSVAVACTDPRTFADLYTSLSRKELGWSEEDYRFWMDTVVENARIKEASIPDGYMKSCESIAAIFFRVLMRCNLLLSQEKPSRPVNQKGGGKREIRYEKEMTPVRKVRMVGPLKVQSEKPPKAPCLETVVTYKTASWTVRGHVRRYKNGKTVYIKPTVRKRKALTGGEEHPTTTIRFRKFDIKR